MHSSVIPPHKTLIHNEPNFAFQIKIEKQPNQLEEGSIRKMSQLRRIIIEFFCLSISLDLGTVLLENLRGREENRVRARMGIALFDFLLCFCFESPKKPNRETSGNWRMGSLRVLSKKSFAIN